MDNESCVGKYIIVKDLFFSDFMKDKDGNINLYGTFDEAILVCGMYEFEDVLIMKVEYNYVD